MHVLKTLMEDPVESARRLAAAIAKNAHEELHRRMSGLDKKAGRTPPPEPGAPHPGGDTPAAGPHPGGDTPIPGAPHPGGDTPPATPAVPAVPGPHPGGDTPPTAPAPPASAV